jgi:hypothetical protein
VLRRIFGPKREEMSGDWRRLHNEELHNLYASPDIIRVIKSRRMRGAGHVARTVQMRNEFNTRSDNLKERERMEDLGIGGKIILKWFLRKESVKVCTGFIWLRTGTSDGLL